MLRGYGGLPVAGLGASASQSEMKKAEVHQSEMLDNDEDEDDDDEQVDDNDINETEETEPIIPNYEGFKAHVLRLNPEMDPRFKWLVSRIAHQQELRYKNLLELRVKHSQAIVAGNCSAAITAWLRGALSPLLIPKAILELWTAILQACKL